MERINSDSSNSVMEINDVQLCYHCGDRCSDVKIIQDGKYFCCDGCKLVFEILNEHNLSNYYKLNRTPGKKKNTKITEGKFDFLNDTEIVRKLITFTDDKITQINFLIPAIHCSSCIWLLENLYKLHPGVVKSVVNYPKKGVSITFSNKDISLKELVAVLHAIGYAPHLSLQNLNTKYSDISNKTAYYKLGVAFFSFGNIMLMSFPEYFGIRFSSDTYFSDIFGYLNILLSLPVLFYSASDFYKSSFNGIRQHRLNMDVPLTLGISAMYLRSLFEILSGTGAGYMDTFTALVFFMLAGRLFQNKTYQQLSFDHDYKSYFPIAVTTIIEGKLSTKPVSELYEGDRIIIRNEELLPVDSELIQGNATIDYSFVTGESKPVNKIPGDSIYAGGKNIGPSIELKVTNELTKSRLTQLWNEENFINKPVLRHKSVVDKVSSYFTIVIIVIALSSFFYYLIQEDLSLAINSFTSVLIITCPCALALSYPFAMGNSIRLMGQCKFYLKNTFVIEKMSGITDIIFDKTGTLTKVGNSEISYNGIDISADSKTALSTLFSQSNHPVSRILVNYFDQVGSMKISEFVEKKGYGLSAQINGLIYKAGSSGMVDVPENIVRNNNNATILYWSCNGKYMGYFKITNRYRTGIAPMIGKLVKKFRLHVLSGDNDAEAPNLNSIFNGNATLLFNQAPEDKLNFVKELQNKHATVMMVGDGLNDAGALRQSDCGIAVTDDVNNFSPACDGIIDANALRNFDRFIVFSKYTMLIIFSSYLISFVYNSVGIWYAVQGLLSPLVAAVIMPLSTVTIIAFTTFSTTLAGRLLHIKD